MKGIVSRTLVESRIDGFTAKFPRFDSRPGARGACKFVSYELCKYLRSRNIGATLVHLQGVKTGTFPNAHQSWLEKPEAEWSHYVVGIGNSTYDLTARQFDPQSPQPLHASLDQLRQVWTVVEEDPFLLGLAQEFKFSHA
jgi:hypothetical protein